MGRIAYVDNAGNYVPPVLTIVRKTADETLNNDNALQNDDHLFFAMAVNEIWTIELRILAISDTGTPDIKWDCVIPVGAAGYGYYQISGAYGQINIGEGTINTPVTSTERLVAVIKYVVINGVNAGNFQWQWAQNVATVENTTVKINSCLIAHELV